MNRAVMNVRKEAKKILVIDHDYLTRTLLLDCLNAEGFEAIALENSLLEARQVKRQAPDLIVFDLLIPDLRCHNTLFNLRQDPLTAAIPFIFLASGSINTELRSMVRQGQDSLLIKPATADDLLGVIETQLAKFSHSDCPSLTTNQPNCTTQSIFPTNTKLTEVFNFIEANYRRPITLQDVAQSVGYSPAYLTNLVGNLTGKTISRWIIERRMVEVRRLLQFSHRSVDDIAQIVGYSSVRHLFRQFRQYHGTTPQGWRAAQAKKRGGNLE